MTRTATTVRRARAVQQQVLDRQLAAVPDTALPDEPRDRARFLAVVILAVVLALVGGGVLLLATRGNQTEDRAEVAEVQRDETAAQAVSFSQQILAECAAGRLVGQICDAARGVAARPIPPVTVSGPSPAEIRAAVAAELAENPPPGGRPPSTAEIAAAVASFLAQNPPEPGRAPTAAEIADAVVVYFAGNPPPAGRPPTSEEIQAAVAAELAQNPPPGGTPGDKGDRGDQGVGVQEVRAEAREDGCVLVFVLLNPADGSTAEQAVPVSSRVCDEGGLLGP